MILRELLVTKSNSTRSKKVKKYLYKYFFYVGVTYLASYIFLNFQIEPELGPGIDPGMALTPFLSSITDETRFEPTIFGS